MYEGKTSGELFKKRKEKQYWTRNCLDRPEMARRKWYWATRNTSQPVTTLQGTVAYPQQLKSTVTNSSRKFGVLSWHRFFLLVQGGKSREKSGEAFGLHTSRRDLGEIEKASWKEIKARNEKYVLEKLFFIANDGETVKIHRMCKYI